MAVEPLPIPHSEAESGLPEPLDQADTLKAHCAHLYGQGLSRAQIARAMAKHLCTPMMRERPLEQQLQRARMKLKKWEQQQAFRDMVYQKAVVQLDMSTPKIMKGVASRAARGRVDAARLVLELTGRHNPKGEQVAPSIVVAINGIPRPQADPLGWTQEALEIDGEAEEV